jgi:quinol monooxygenase YgiN
MMISVLKFMAVTEKRGAILEILRTIERRTRGKLGCMECGVYESREDGDGGILYFEKWNSKEDLYRHIKSDSYILVLTVMEFASQKPEIYFLENPETDRMAVIKALRSKEKENG